MRIPIDLGLGSYESPSVPFSAQRCINMYAVAARSKSLNDVALFSTPGIVSFGDVSGNVIVGSQGATVMNGVYYVVNNQKLYSIDSSGTESLLGTIVGATRVSMANNGEKLVIVVPGGNAYVWNATTTTLTQITDSDFRTSDTVCFKDGYFIFTATDSKVWFNSNLNDPLTYDALDFGSAELQPDNNVACFVNYDEVFILGEWSTEVFQNVAGSGFPFQRIQGAAYEKGCHARHTPIEWEGSFYFLGGGRNEKTTVFRAGTTAEPVNISTDAIDNEIQKFTPAEIAEAFSFSYSVRGAAFIGFTIKSVDIASKTFVYNVTASKLLGRDIWLEQQSGISDNYWRVNTVDYVYNKLLVTDLEDGRIGYLDIDTYTEYGNTILRVRTTGPIENNGQSAIIDSLELKADAGKGILSGQGSDPQVMLEWSDDGARTWSGEIWAPLGKIGEYYRRTEWRRLGRIPYDRVWRFKVSDPVPVTFMKATAEVRGGR
jgi:hypothetical protein